MDNTSHLARLQEQGYRITLARRALIDLFSRQGIPLSANEIFKRLQDKKLRANKTTVYRELDFFKQQGIVQEVEFGDRVKRYEAVSEDHHHHAVCLSCRKVEDIPLSNDLERERKNIEQRTDFRIINHSLEFFGLCKSCSE